MNDYTQRVHRAMDHIRAHLDEDLSLVEVAKVALFSPYHFHRVFKSSTGETVASFTRRARLERALRLMRANPSRALSSIALEVGFATPSEFSRIFRAAYGLAPSAWDRSARLLLGLSWDHEKGTAIERLVYDLGFALGADAEPFDEFGVVELPALRAVEVRCHSLFATAKAWDFLYRSWLPGSEHEPEDLPAIKRFWQTPKVLDEHAWKVDCSIAVRARRP